ncbi:hypothetical protein TRFO_15692 [Tritrichomonas foetus]|uniref:SUN domain-containing protein n=1 Tax=Tritrichomonas foetus TaxID=1144522 RepID=A0A1J4KSF4_9EUKA|nr:hypothetical protein TRFO_15692 [Tritrichomonas foetus]|eukprot:OHT14034.1 hypothetical protein TRFO_15692 [Tritrichomonas foetus]
MFVFLLSLIASLETSNAKQYNEIPLNSNGQEPARITKSDDVNQTLITEIRNLMNSVKNVVEQVNSTQREIDLELQKLSDQLEKLENEKIDLKSLNQVVKEIDQINSQISNKLSLSIRENIQKLLSAKCVAQEITLYYIPASMFLTLNSIKPFSSTATQIKEKSNFTFETYHPYATNRVIFENLNIRSGQSSVATKANFLFYLKGHLIHTLPSQVIYKNSENAEIKFDQPIVFDRFVVQCLDNIGNETHYTVPEFHLYEPERLRI